MYSYVFFCIVQVLISQKTTQKKKKKKKKEKKKREKEIYLRLWVMPLLAKKKKKLKADYLPVRQINLVTADDLPVGQLEKV